MRELKRDQKLLDELEGLDDSERSQATARLAEEQRKVAARLCLCVALDCKSKEAMQAQIKIALAAGLESEDGLEEAMQALQRKESLERKAMSAAPSHPDPRAQGVSEAQGVSRACTCDGPLEPPTPEPPAPARPTGRWGSLRRSVPVAPRPPNGPPPSIAPVAPAPPQSVPVAPAPRPPRPPDGPPPSKLMRHAFTARADPDTKQQENKDMVAALSDTDSSEELLPSFLRGKSGSSTSGKGSSTSKGEGSSTRSTRRWCPGSSTSGKGSSTSKGEGSSTSKGRGLCASSEGKGKLGSSTSEGEGEGSSTSKGELGSSTSKGEGSTIVGRGLFSSGEGEGKLGSSTSKDEGKLGKDEPSWNSHWLTHHWKQVGQEFEHLSSNLASSTSKGEGEGSSTSGKGKDKLGSSTSGKGEGDGKSGSTSTSYSVYRPSVSSTFF